MYGGLGVKVNMHESCIMGEDCEPICFAMRLWLEKKPKDPQIEPHGWRRHYMGWYIGGLSSQVYICGLNI